jgi:hypothetical protein
MVRAADVLHTLPSDESRRPRIPLLLPRSRQTPRKRDARDPSLLIHADAVAFGAIGVQLCRTFEYHWSSSPVVQPVCQRFAVEWMLFKPHSILGSQSSLSEHSLLASQGELVQVSEEPPPAMIHLLYVNCPSF